MTTHHDAEITRTDRSGGTKPAATFSPAGIVALLAALLLPACYDAPFGEPGRSDVPPAATTTIAEVQRLFTGEPVTVESDLVVTGVVTTSDAAGNFYRTLCIEEAGAGIEITAGLDHLHNDYPAGCRVTLRLRGLALGRHYGVLQAGAPALAGSGYPTGWLGSPAAVGGCLIRHGEELQPLRPTLLTIGELTPALCGTLVRIEGLRYAPDALGQGTWAGYKRFEDEAGAVVYTYVRTGAGFADEEVPAGIRSLTGILQYDAPNRFILKLRDTNDCAE